MTMVWTGALSARVGVAASVTGSARAEAQDRRACGPQFELMEMNRRFAAAPRATSSNGAADDKMLVFNLTVTLDRVRGRLPQELRDAHSAVSIEGEQ